MAARFSCSIIRRSPDSVSDGTVTLFDFVTLFAMFLRNLALLAIFAPQALPFAGAPMLVDERQRGAVCVAEQKRVCGRDWGFPTGFARLHSQGCVVRHPVSDHRNRRRDGQTISGALWRRAREHRRWSREVAGLAAVVTSIASAFSNQRFLSREPERADHPSISDSNRSRLSRRRGRARYAAFRALLSLKAVGQCLQKCDYVIDFFAGQRWFRATRSSERRIAIDIRPILGGKIVED